MGTNHTDLLDFDHFHSATTCHFFVRHEPDEEEEEEDDEDEGEDTDDNEENDDGYSE
jgi:hypothetical protein